MSEIENPQIAKTGGEKPGKERQTLRKTLTGQVVSDRMDKTVKVVVERRVKHPLYQKYVSRSTRLLAHDEKNECKEGDLVQIEECRPLSKRKAWRLVRVIVQATRV
jgi:small subunit ribosomal protein S17